MAKLAKIATARQAQLKDGRRLGFAEYGDPTGKPVFMFHDLWGNRTLRHPDDNILKQLGIRLIGIDRPGYGMSTRKLNRNLMDVVDDIMMLAIGLNINKFSVLGYSAGAPYALACAYRFPQIVTRCAVVSSLPPMDDEQGFKAVNANYARLFQIAQNMESFFRLLIQGFFWFDARRGSDHYIKELTASMPAIDKTIMSNPQVFASRRAMWGEIRQNGSEAFVDEMMTLVKSWGFHLQSINVPVDVWWGESDTMSAPIVGKRMAEFIPNSTLHLEPRAGHLIFYSHWQPILKSLMQS
jgi:pimeloyl-ACP methyl ester carboxylesterase